MMDAIGTWCDRHVPSTFFPSTSLGPVHPLGVRKPSSANEAFRPGRRCALAAVILLISATIVSGSTPSIVHGVRLGAFDEVRLVAVTVE